MHIRSRLFYAVCCALCLAVILAACGPRPPQELVFSVVESGESSQWTSDDPGLLLVAAPGDIAAAAAHLSPEGAALLETLDYAREFALVVLRGHDARIPAEDPIHRIIWWGNVVTVQMHLGEESAAAPTGSPYTLVRVEKGALWEGAHTLRLVTPGTVQNIITMQQPIP